MQGSSHAGDCGHNHIQVMFYLLSNNVPFVSKDVGFNDVNFNSITIKALRHF